MKCELTTNENFTLTDDGMIPHKRHPKHGFLMPVRLYVNIEDGVRRIMKPMPPVRDGHGRLHYAMPGGGVYVEH